MSTGKCLKALKRRADFLEKRVENAKKKGRDLSFDKEEFVALKVAISLIEEYESWDEDEDLGTQVFGWDWRDKLALTQEEREMLSGR